MDGLTKDLMFGKLGIVSDSYHLSAIWSNRCCSTQCNHSWLLQTLPKYSNVANIAILISLYQKSFPSSSYLGNYPFVTCFVIISYPSIFSDIFYFDNTILNMNGEQVLLADVLSPLHHQPFSWQGQDSDGGTWCSQLSLRCPLLINPCRFEITWYTLGATLPISPLYEWYFTCFVMAFKLISVINLWIFLLMKLKPSFFSWSVILLYP